MRLIPHSRPIITDKDIQSVTAAMRELHLSGGEEAPLLENELSEMFGGRHTIAVSSGTAALYLSLIAAGLQAGKSVIIPSYTCNSLFSAVSFAGGKVICADTIVGGVNIDRSTVEPLLSKSAAAIIAPHTCGYLADVDGIKELGIPVIEDCAQAVGGYYPDGAMVGTKGDIAVLSFYATKLVQAGEGGACITADPDLAGLIRQLRDCDKREPDPRAFNFKMSGLNAALALEKLSALRENIAHREIMASQYDDAFGTHSFRNISSQKQSVCFRYLLEITGSLEHFLSVAQKSGIICERPIWRALHHATGNKCPNTESLEKTLASIPLYPGLTAEEIEKIVSVIAGLI